MLLSWCSKLGAVPVTFVSCCTDLKSAPVRGNPVAKHRGASLDGISRFYFVASCLRACLPTYYRLYFVILLLRQSILNIGNSSAWLSVSHWHSLRGINPQRFSPPAYEYDPTYQLFRQQTRWIWSCRNLFLIIPFSPSSGLLFFFILAFPAAMPCKSAKPDVLEQRITSTRE